MKEFKIEQDPEGKWKACYICTFCGTPYESKEEACQCWASHSSFTIEYIYGGIGSETDMPIECIIKKNERGFITEIGTYKLENVVKVNIKAKKDETKER